MDIRTLYLTPLKEFIDRYPKTEPRKLNKRNNDLVERDRDLVKGLRDSSRTIPSESIDLG